MVFRKLFFIAVWAGIAFTAASGVSVYAQPYQSEEILSFRSYLQVHEDGSMAVTETIKVMCQGNQIKRGIYRDFPTRYRDRFGNNYRVDFEVIDVLRDGVPESHHFEYMSNGVRVYLGKKEVYLSPGEYTYSITYATNRQLGFFKEYDELYWNVTGNGWGFPVEHAVATVELPGDASERIIRLEAFTGPQGAAGKNYLVNRDGAGNAVFETTSTLWPREGLTIRLAWPKGYVREPTPQMELGYFIRDNRDVLVGLLGFLFLLGYYTFLWVRVGRDPAKGTIIPLYGPPANFSPAAVRYLMKMGYDHKVFTSCIIDMAVRGYLTIEEDKKVFTLKRTVVKDSALTLEEVGVAKRLFASSEEITLRNENHGKISGAVLHVQSFLKKNLEKTYFFTNVQYFIPGVLLSALIIIASCLVQSSGKMPVIIFMSLWLTIWTVVVAGLLQQAFSLWRNSAGNKASLGRAVFLTLFATPFVIAEVIGVVVLASQGSFALVIMLALLACVNFIFYSLLKAPTLNGRRIMDQVEGFKMYLAVAEKDRLNYVNPPLKTPELFEKYLPYALALDVEQAWAEQFSDILKEAAQGQEGYSPRWYSGTSWSTLGAGGFSTGLGSSFSSAISSSSVAPGSGGGGGGSSGGGGGGGGGGGW